MPTYVDQDLVVGDDVTFGIHAKRNSLAWDITGGTVLLYLRNPATGAWGSSLAGTVTSGPDGEAIYVAPETTLTDAGTWKRQWEITKGGVTKRTAAIEFEVRPWQP